MASAPETAPSHSPAAGDRIEPYVWRIAGVVILGMIMSILDTTIVNVALRTLGHDLHSSISQIQWVVTGYLCRWPLSSRSPAGPPGVMGPSAST
jgi:MFS family permease